jgi:hypothetical protein
VEGIRDARRSEESVTVFAGHEELLHVWEPRFQHQYGCLRDEVTKALTEYLNCGILAHGRDKNARLNPVKIIKPKFGS